MLKAIKINPADNVAVVPQDVNAGEQVQVVETGEVFTATEFIKAGHKMALVDFKAGDTVVKYGIPIGKMMSDCPKGGWIHCHNVEDTTAELCTGYCEQYRNAGRKIMAFPRPNGDFGISNYIMIFSTSVAANAMAEELANKTDVIWMVCDKNRLENGKISDFTKMVITKTAQNPNIYAAMIVGSEEDNALNEAITQEIKTTGKQAVYVGVKSGVCEHKLADNVKVLETWKKEAASLKREPCSMEGFTMAIHCGGSDWTTALSGNPTLGVASDLVVEQGGFVIMDEWGGLPGSEHLLASHAVTRKVGLGVIDKVMDTRERFLRDTGKPVEATNPYPSNKEGGITTLVEKSTGNIKKAGSSGLQGILKMATRPTTPGVYLQDQPCGGPSATGIYAAMSGCHLNIFVTGVGYVYYEIPHMLGIRMTGNPDTFKVEDYKLDFNAGVVIEGKPMQEAGKDLFEYIIAVAEGREVPKNEAVKCKAFPMYYYEDEFNEAIYCRVKDYKEEVMKRVDAIKA